MNLRNPGCPTYDFYKKKEKKKISFLVTFEQKLGPRAYRALLEHSALITLEFCR